MNASDEELDALHGAAGRWEKRSAWVLLAGLAAEVVFIWAPTATFWTRLGDTAATIMVVVGVWAEVAFGNAGAEAQGEQLRRSKENVAGLIEDHLLATKRLTVAEETVRDALIRAATLEKEAAETRRVAAWRELSLEAAQKLVDGIRAFDRPSVSFWLWSGDPESNFFARRLADAFRANGWMIRFEHCGYSSDPVFGLIIAPWGTVLPPSQENRDLSAKVQEAFAAASIQFSVTDPPKPYMSTGEGRFDAGRNVVVYVGPRPPVQFPT
jgi:hypothetical protein